jgi:uncharacterized membrane protein YeaQ/YmgE (transglycosylase-associated protein family)
MTLEQIAREVLSYIQSNMAINAVIAVITGFAACKSVASDWKDIGLLFILVGILGFFLGQFVIISLGLKEFLDLLPQFTWLFDILIGFVGSFVVATVVNFFKPT